MVERDGQHGGFRRWLLACFLKATVMSMSVAQGPSLGPPPPFKPVVTIRGGGVEHNAPYRVPQRLVQGVVHDKSEHGIAKARVYLKDDRTSQVRVLTTDEKGAYLFGGLPLTHDYEVWFERDKQRTPAKLVSSYVGAHDITINLKSEDLRPMTPEELKAEAAPQSGAKTTQ